MNIGIFKFKIKKKRDPKRTVNYNFFNIKVAVTWKRLFPDLYICIFYKSFFPSFESRIISQSTAGDFPDTLYIKVSINFYYFFIVLDLFWHI